MTTLKINGKEVKTNGYFATNGQHYLVIEDDADLKAAKESVYEVLPIEKIEEDWNEYGGTTAMGWRNIKKPEHFTWEQYAKFLIKTLPKDFKERIEYNITRIMNTWENDGYGRNPRVIKTMEDEGVILEKTGVDDPRCTKPGFYEIVKIKSGMPDETSEPMFRKVPSWKGVCITILKNDFTCQYMGVSRSDKDMAKRREAMKKYKAIL